MSIEAKRRGRRVSSPETGMKQSISLRRCAAAQTVTAINWSSIWRAFVMVALWNRADHYIFMLWFVLSSIPFFPRLISAAADWMSAILPHMVWP